MTKQSNNHPLAESVSALADNEASPLELHRLLKASESDPEIKSTWARYQLISAALRHDLPEIQTGDFAARMSAALEDEVSHKGAPGKASQWWKNLGRVGVAASVAVVAIMGVQQLPGHLADPELAAAGQTAQSSEVTRSEAPSRSAVSLPAGYYSPSLPVARTASAQSGYEPRSRDARQVLFEPRQQESVPVNIDEIRAHLHQLIQEHSDHAALNSNHGALPYARVVADDED
ncbi:sigma-E factor negative regulatory protein [Marinimicrobium sp. ABcell2]|uniref:sigma-E factor negative regulatory protein n=1 Tax=Marinimicrobium sp. ABcell2 TaxID=3069751 RepID=UPI0027B23494|nr:sigma-E factor negative regulatory protein [Marinimicrobium sp. ABcell2]MDQ2075278.1 sigma-E factor negative regulatory protein [Marinimicrobium sp. ABcell2]